MLTTLHGLLASQQRVVEERLAKIRGYIEGEGRRYRIHHGAIRGRFNWKPEGPVFHVPPSVMKAPGARATIWAGGMRFEKGDLVLTTKKVPILFRHDYLEWIDRDPAPDGADLSIESARREGGVHHRLRLTTDGFVLEVGRARVERSEGLVKIRPLPAR